MDSPGGQGKHIVTEEQFRNFYPDVSIQPSKKATLDLEKRLAVKSSPTKAAVVMTKTPVAVKSLATPKSSNLRTTNSVAAKTNSPMVAKSPSPVTPKTSAVTKTIVPLKTPVASKVAVVCNSPSVTTGRTAAAIKAPVNKPAVVVKTPAAAVKIPTAKTPPAALRAPSIKLLPPTPKLVATTPILPKTPQSIAKPQQTSSLMKIQPKTAVMAVSNKDGSDQSTITVLNFSVPAHPGAQRSSNQ